MNLNPSLAKIVLDLLGKYAETGCEHRAVIGFYLKINLRYLSESKLDEQLAGIILSSILSSISTVESVEAAVCDHLKWSC
jgi:hypothetical protein